VKPEMGASAAIKWPCGVLSHPELIHFTAKAGEVYYYLVRGIVSDGAAAPAVMIFGPAGRDEALFLIASDPQNTSTPRPAAKP